MQQVRRQIRERARRPAWREVEDKVNYIIKVHIIEQFDNQVSDPIDEIFAPVADQTYDN